MSDVDDTEHQPAPLDHLLAQKNVKKSGPTPGIIYISRLPPGMTPQKVKHLLGSHGEVGRIYAQRKEREWKGHGPFYLINISRQS